MPRKGKTRRIGITRYVGNIIDDTKDFLDDVLDRARDTERDLRDTAVRALRYDDPDDDRQDLEELRAELDRLSEKIAKRSAPESTAQPAVEGGAR